MYTGQGGYGMGHCVGQGCSQVYILSLDHSPGGLSSTMIYDGHAYIFPDMKGDGGFDDRDEFQRHLQLAIATHFMPVWRTRDRAEADNSGLLDPTMPRGFGALKEADFRATQFGRFEWTVDGEDYFKQYMPPSVVDMEFTADDLIAEMDYAEVDWALLHRTPYLGIGNDLVADAVRAYPDRIQALAHVPEWKIAPEPDRAIAELDHAINDLGLHGLQLCCLTTWPSTASRPSGTTRRSRRFGTTSPRWACPSS